MTLLEDSCSFKDTLKNLATTGLTDARKKELALGTKGTNDAGATETATLAAQTGTTFYVDHDYIKCTKNGGGMSDMLPLMMMGGGNMGGMDPMMMMLMMDGSSGMSDMLPLMMMNQPAADPTNPNAAAAPAMNPLMMMTLLDDSTDTKTGCDKKFKIEYAIKSDKSKITTPADIRAAVLADGLIDATASKWSKDYKLCLTKATKEGSSSSSSLSDSLLPLMMMGGMGGAGGAGQMDPMMMMLMLKD